MLPARGRPGQALLMTVKRELTVMDMIRLETESAPKTAVPVLQRLKASHHMAARLLAAGRSIRDTAYAVGLTPQRISDLQTQDPTFQDLVSYYQDQIAESNIQDASRVGAKLLDVAETATDEIASRLDDPEKLAQIPIGELRQIAVMGLDRTVAPPKTAQPVVVTPTQITFNMGTKDIRPKVIDEAGNPVPEIEGGKDAA